MLEIFREGVNPAVCLYDLWIALSDGYLADDNAHMTHYRADKDRLMNQGVSNYTLGRSIRFGQASRTYVSALGIDPATEQQILGFGVTYSGNIYPRLLVTSDGRFAVRRQTHPSILERDTFLGCNYVARRPHWYIAPRLSYEPHVDLTDFQTRIPYIPQSLLMTSGYRYYHSADHWWKLDLNQDGYWDLTPTPSPWGTSNDRDYHYLLSMFEDFQKLRERRYRRRENQHRRSLGLSDLPSKFDIARAQEIAVNIAATIDVTEPAKAVPLRPRLVEAQRGASL